MSQEIYYTKQYYLKEISKMRKLYQKILTQDLENFISAETPKARNKAKASLLKFAFGKEKDIFNFYAELANINPSYMRKIIRNTLKEFEYHSSNKKIRHLLKQKNKDNTHKHPVYSKYIKSVYFDEIY